MELSKNREDLQKWFLDMQNISLNQAYSDIKDYVYYFLNIESEKPNNRNFSQYLTQKIAPNFFSRPIDCPGILDHIANVTLLNILLRKYEFDFPFHTAEIGNLDKYFNVAKLLDTLCEFKCRFAKQVLFVKSLERCLDEDLSNRKYNFQLELSPKIRKEIFSNLDGLRNDEFNSISEVLAGIGSFFNTPVKNIRCMPKHAAILLKAALPCWIFLALNLPSNEIPTEEKINRLLNARTPEEGRKRYPAIDKFLKPLCAAFHLYLETRAGKSFANSVIEKYELSDYIASDQKTDQLLLQSQNKFMKVVIQSILERQGKPVLRGWAQRDIGTSAFDRQLQPYAGIINSTKADEDEFSRFIKMTSAIMNHMGKKDNTSIQTIHRYLEIYQAISTVKCCTVDGNKNFHANETFNLILFECITGLITWADFELRCPTSFYLPLLSDEVLYALTVKPKEARDTNPFYRLHSKDPITSHLNELRFYESDLDVLNWLRGELLCTVDYSEIKENLKQLDPMAGHLKALLSLTSPLPEFFDA